MVPQDVIIMCIINDYKKNRKETSRKRVSMTYYVKEELLRLYSVQTMIFDTNYPRRGASPAA